MVSDACKIVKTYLDDFESQKERGMGLYIWSRTKEAVRQGLLPGLQMN